MKISCRKKTEKIKTIEDYTSYTTINHSNIYNNLVSRGDVRELAKGSFAYSGLFLDIYEYFERKIDEFACSKFKKYKKNCVSRFAFDSRLYKRSLF